jgi:hypothetical protein
MSVTVALHDPATARVTEFHIDGQPRACLHLADAKGRTVEVYTYLGAAHAMAAAFAGAQAQAVASSEAP